MRTILLAIMLACSGAGAAGAALDQPRGETPRATDLLRAQRLADEVRRRLDLPPPVRLDAGWRRGGQGWPRRDAPAAALAQDGDVIINVKPPGRRAPDGAARPPRPAPAP